MAPDFKISFDVNLFQKGSRGRLKSFAEVATVPPGKIPTIPPPFRKRIASFLVFIFWRLPSLFSSKLIGRTTSSRSFAFLKTLLAIILKSFRVLDKIYPRSNPSKIPNGWLETITTGPFLGISSRDPSTKFIFMLYLSTITSQKLRPLATSMS